MSAEDTATLDITVKVESESDEFTLETDESYSLSLAINETGSKSSRVSVLVEAETFLGARHGLETLFQLTDWDPEDEKFIIIDSATITDTPYFKHRFVFFFVKNLIIYLIITN